MLVFHDYFLSVDFLFYETILGVMGKNTMLVVEVGHTRSEISKYYYVASIGRSSSY